MIKQNETNLSINISKSIVSRYVNMKAFFGNKVKDPIIKVNLTSVIVDYFPENLDKSYQNLKDKFGEEIASQSVQVLFGAYIDGYLDPFKQPIIKLYNERQEELN